MSVRTSWLSFVCVLALWAPLLAQDEPAPSEPPPAEPKPAPAPAAEAKPPAKAHSSIEEPELHRWGGWTLSGAVWGPTLIGADEEVANRDVGGIFQPELQRGDTRYKITSRVTYHLPHDKGSIVGQYDSMNNEDKFQVVTPGVFDFLETRVYPAYPGVFDDGRADGVSSSAIRRTREFRLEYQNKAFESKWARGLWSVGFRQLSHERALGIDYYSLVPNLPPVIPPVGNPGVEAALKPFPDTAGQSSDFDGHGLGASFDVEFPLHPRVSIITGLSLGIVRGTIRSSYISTTSYYYLTSAPGVAIPTDQLIVYLNNPTPETAGNPQPGDPPRNPKLSEILQQGVTVGVNTTDTSQMATSFDVYIGIQATVWRGLKVFVLARDVAYNNVGTYVVPKPGPVNVTTALNDGYKGYALGLSWRF